jgi:calcium-dependent protein kinase
MNDLIIFFQGLSKLESKQSKEIESVITSMDTDGSGTINYTEFIAASMDKSLYMKEEKLIHAFKMLDQDGSGKISKEELKNVLGTDEQYKEMSDDYWTNMIKEADKNGDGEVMKKTKQIILSQK